MLAKVHIFLDFLKVHVGFFVQHCKSCRKLSSRPQCSEKQQSAARQMAGESLRMNSVLH